MLWIDARFVTAADLNSLDAEASQIATDEGITLDGANGLISRALTDAAGELTKNLDTYGQYAGGSDLSLNHLRAVLRTGSSSLSSRLSLEQIVVSGPTDDEWSTVQLWAARYALRELFLAAFNRNTSDRYLEKLEQGKKKIDTLWMQLMASGIPAVIQPLYRPAASGIHGSGTWSAANLSAVSGSGSLDDSVDVAVTWVADPPYVSASNPARGESHPSDRVSVVLASGQVASVGITSLVPPSGVQPDYYKQRAVVSPLKATHWNVYAAVSGGTLRLQNATPIPVATTSYTLTGDPSTSGAIVGLGQAPNSYVRLALQINRA